MIVYFQRDRRQCTMSNDVHFPCQIREKSERQPASVHALRPADIMVIAAIGDSITCGTGALAKDVSGINNEYRGIAFSIGKKVNNIQFIGPVHYHFLHLLTLIRKKDTIYQLTFVDFRRRRDLARLCDSTKHPENFQPRPLRLFERSDAGSQFPLPFTEKGQHCPQQSRGGWEIVQLGGDWRRVRRRHSPSREPRGKNEDRQECRLPKRLENDHRPRGPQRYLLPRLPKGVISSTGQGWLAETLCGKHRKSTRCFAPKYSQGFR